MFWTDEICVCCVFSVYHALYLDHLTCCDLKEKIATLFSVVISQVKEVFVQGPSGIHVSTFVIIGSLNIKCGFITHFSSYVMLTKTVVLVYLNYGAEINSSFEKSVKVL